MFPSAISVTEQTISQATFWPAPASSNSILPPILHWTLLLVSPNPRVKVLLSIINRFSKACHLVALTKFPATQEAAKLSLLSCLYAHREPFVLKPTVYLRGMERILFSIRSKGTTNIWVAFTIQLTAWATQPRDRERHVLRLFTKSNNMESEFSLNRIGPCWVLSIKNRER